MTARRTPGGQTAVPFIVFLGILLIFVGVTVNLGQVSLVRTETSNAADAGALAIASWRASGNNEAAWIARKMWTTLTMVNGIFRTAPFCRTETARTYGHAIWGNAVIFNTYLRYVAERVLMGAWNLSRREGFTAAMNNIMIRYQFGRNISDATLIDGIHSTMEGKVREWQQFLADDPLFDLGSIAVEWSTGPEEVGTLHHVATYRIDDSSEGPAALVARPWQVDGLVWTECKDVGSPGHPYFPCCHSDTIGYQSGLAADDLSTFLPLPPTAPEAVPMIREGGAVVNGRKVWDIDLTRVVPNPAAAVIGSCGGACELEPIQDWDSFFDPQPVAPFAIVNGAGDVQVRVHHEVQAFDGMLPIDGSIVPVPIGGEVPKWRPFFKPIGSEASANWTAPPVGTPFPERTGRAELTGSR